MIRVTGRKVRCDSYPDPGGPIARPKAPGHKSLTKSRSGIGDKEEGTRKAKDTLQVSKELDKARGKSWKRLACGRQGSREKLLNWSGET